jgi:signal peptidase I
MQQHNASVATHKSPIRTSIAAGALLAVALLLWLAFTPASLGGPFSYVIITGDSMSPAIDDGDIVLLRRAPDYDVGQVVVYRHPELGVVVHRITEELGASFVVKGDNRNLLIDIALPVMTSSAPKSAPSAVPTNS